MRRLLAIALVVLGIAGLVLGRLGETVWAPSTERSASVSLEDPGAAVLIDPGVAYVGGHEGTIGIEAPADVHIIPVDKADAEAYLGGAKRTEITGVPDWSTLSTSVKNPDGETTLPDPASADLWTTVVDSPSPATVDIATLWREDGGAKPALPYRSLLVVTDGTQAGASEVTITWPVDARNAWVPYAYAIGAALAVLGLILFALEFTAASSRRRRAGAELDDEARRTREPAAVRAADVEEERPAEVAGEREHPVAVTGDGADRDTAVEGDGAVPFPATGRGRRRAAVASDEPTTELARHDDASDHDDQRGEAPEEDQTR